MVRSGALSWFGIGLADLLRARAAVGRPPSAKRPVRGVILAFCPGEPGHLETLDPKPEAPRDIRGSFDTIEFGRTPRVGTPIKGGAGATPTGRDHWPGVFSLLAFGAGVGRSRVLGASDRLASQPSAAALTPADLAANILQALGVDPSAEIRDMLGRPFPVNSGTPIPWA